MSRSISVAACLLIAAAVSGARAQTPPQARDEKPAPTEAQAKRQALVEALKKYVGRYALDAGLFPVTTLDVTLEGAELWVKPSAGKRRRLVSRGRGRFVDELEGAAYVFNRDEEGRVLGLTFQLGRAEHMAARVELPAPSLKGNTTFRLKGHAGAGVVALAGTFNGWNESQLIFGREGGEWVCRVDLDPGRYGYKFIVDGDWLLDPANPETEEDEAGNVNSVVEVTKKPPGQ